MSGSALRSPAVLFTIGKFLLGLYLGRASTVSVYGAFGSLVALLLWTYYSAQIFFFGAEFTQVYVERHGGRGQVGGERRADNGGGAGPTRGCRASRPFPRWLAKPNTTTSTAGALPRASSAESSIDRPPFQGRHPLSPPAPDWRREWPSASWAAWNRLSRRSLQHDLRRTHLDQRLSNLETRIGPNPRISSDTRRIMASANASTTRVAKSVTSPTNCID